MKNKRLAMAMTLFIMLFSSCVTANFGDFTKSFFGEKLTNLTEEEQFERKMRNYKLEAVIETTKGKLNVILYPDAAPNNVAHFVFLVKKGFYNGLRFHRVIPSALIQTGDNIGDGTGTDGNILNDEFVDWLDYNNAGMLGMANNGPNRNSSQIFFTLASTPQYNNNYTIIGELSKRDDLSIARLIREDDKIINIEIKGIDIDSFLDNFKKNVEEWEK